MRILPFLSLLLAASIYSCTKDSDTTPNQKPQPFEVEVTYRAETDAAIEWTEAEDSPGDSVHYEVFLHATKVDSNLAVLSDTLKKLLPDSSYNGYVVAIDNKGDTSVAHFHIPAFRGFLLSWYRGALRNYNIATKKLEWTGYNFPYTAIPPAMNGDTVFSAGYSLQEINLFAHNIKTGEMIWSSDTERPTPPLSPIQNASVLAHENGILAMVVMNDVYGFSSKDGSFMWRQNISIDGSYQMQPVMVGGKVFIGGNTKNFFAFDAVTGAPKWTYNTKETLLWSNPAVAHGKVFFGTENGTFFALNTDDGSLAWKFRSTGAAITASPRIDGNSVLISLNDGLVHSFDALTGRENWKCIIPGYYEVSGVAVDHNTAYVNVNKTDKSTLVAIDKKSGNLRWMKETTAFGSVEPVVAANRIYMNAGYEIHIFNASTGQLIDKITRVVVPAMAVIARIDDHYYYPAESPDVQ